MTKYNASVGGKSHPNDDREDEETDENDDLTDEEQNSFDNTNEFVENAVVDTNPQSRSVRAGYSNFAPLSLSSAGLVFPVGRVHRELRMGQFAARIGFLPSNFFF